MQSVFFFLSFLIRNITFIIKRESTKRGDEMGSSFRFSMLTNITYFVILEVLISFMSLQKLYSQRLSISVCQFSAGFDQSECHPKYIRFQQSHECKCP